MDIQGKTAIVTGGASGIGRAVVGKLLARGAAVAVLDVDEGGLRELEGECENVHALVCDVSDCEQVEASVAEAFEVMGQIDILVNNAGILYSAPLVNIMSKGDKKHDIGMWRKVIETDLSSVFYVTVNVVEGMVSNRTKGVIVNVSSVAASGNPGQSAYSAAKAGVEALTATWAKELGTFGIRAVAVAPGFTETESTRLAVSEAVLKDWVRRIPLRRLATTDEIADGILTAIGNDYLTGTTLSINGGLVI